MLFLALLILLSVAGGLISLLLRLLRKPIKWAFKLLFHALAGFLFLVVFNFVGVWLGVQLEITLLNAVIAGVLGIPGVLILLVLALL